MAKSGTKITGVIFVAGDVKNKKLFFDALGNVEFPESYHPDSHGAGTKHVLCSRPIVVRDLGLSDEESKAVASSNVDAVQLISIPDFTADNAFASAFVSLSALLAALHMRSQPMIGIIFLYRLPLVRLKGTGVIVLRQLGQYFIGSTSRATPRSRIAFVTVNWAQKVPSQQAQKMLAVEKEFASKYLPTYFPVNGGSLSAGDPTISMVDFRGDPFGYYRLATAMTISNPNILQTSAKSILLSFVDKNALIRLPPLLRSEILESPDKMERGLGGTTLGRDLAERLSEKANSSISEDTFLEKGEFRPEGLAEVASFDIAMLQLRLSSTLNAYVEKDTPYAGLTQGKTFIMVFGYHQGLQTEFSPKNDKISPDLPLVQPLSEEGPWLLLLPGFTYSGVDEMLLTSLVRYLAFLMRYKFRLVGIACLLQWIARPRLDHISRHNLDMMEAVCGKDCFPHVLFAKLSEKATWSEMERKSNILSRFGNATFLDHSPQETPNLAINVYEHFRPNRVSILDRFALMKELTSGFSTPLLAETTAGKKIQALMTYLMTKVQGDESGYDKSTDREGLDIRAFYLQLGIMRLSETFNVYKEVYSKLETDTGLEKAISRLEALLLCQSDSFNGKCHTCGHLGGLYLEHFDRHGERRDLFQSVKHYEKAVQLVPDSDPATKAKYLKGLTKSLAVKFKIFGKKTDIVDAVNRCREIVDNLMDLQGANFSAVDKALAVHALGSMLKTRFAVYFKEVQDIDDAIGYFHRAEGYLPQNHHGIPVVIAEIASSHTLRSKYQKQVKKKEHMALIDIENAIREYNRMRPEPRQGQFAYPVLQNVKCKALGKHFKLLKDSKDLDPKLAPSIEEAIVSGEEAVKYSYDMAEACTYRLNLGKAYAYRHLYPQHEEDSQEKDLEEALFCMKAAVKCEVAEQMTRFKAARNWGKWAQFEQKAESAQRPDQTSRRQKILEAYEHCIAILSKLVGDDIPIDEQYRRLEKVQSVVHFAVDVALQYGISEKDNSPELGRVVEWFEEGRAVVWKHYFKRDEVVEAARINGGEKGKELVEKFERNWFKKKSAVLKEQGNGQYIEAAVGDGGEKATERERQSETYTSMVAEEKVNWREIRDLVEGGNASPGSESGTEDEKWERLGGAATFGPVVLVHVTDKRSDAIILVKDRERSVQARHVDLSKLVEGAVISQCAKEWRTKLKETLDAGGLLSGRGTAPPRNAGQVTEVDGHLEKILGGLWRLVAWPIVNILKNELNIPSGSRLFWCPSGPLAFLPLHAAGVYEKAGKLGGIRCVADWFVPSYIPSLYALLRVSRKQDSHRHHDPSDDSQEPTPFLLAVAQPNADIAKYAHIPGTMDEVNEIRRLGSSRVQICAEESATVDKVKDELLNCEWAHFACHGIQDAGDGLKSSLVLHQGKQLVLKELIEMRTRNAHDYSRDGLGTTQKDPEFAYLSACQSATGDDTLPDEHVHLAAGMLVSGYLGVVASMWSIQDKEGTQVAKAVYKSLFKDYTTAETSKPDYKLASKALRDAVKDLRMTLGRKDYLKWLPFVHVGL